MTLKVLQNWAVKELGLCPKANCKCEYSEKIRKFVKDLLEKMKD